jgi:hypothetical protein
MSTRDEEKALRFGAGALNSMLSSDIFDKVRQEGHIYWEGSENFELFKNEGRKTRIQYQNLQVEDTKPRRVIRVSVPYKYPDESGLLSVERFEWSNFYPKASKATWLMTFAKRYNISGWKKKDFLTMGRKQLNAVWARYYRIDKTAAQIALELRVAFEDRQDHLSIGEWPNPYLPPEGTQFKLPI